MRWVVVIYKLLPEASNDNHLIEYEECNYHTRLISSFWQNQIGLQWFNSKTMDNRHPHFPSRIKAQRKTKNSYLEWDHYTYRTRIHLFCMEWDIWEENQGMESSDGSWNWNSRTSKWNEDLFLYLDLLAKEPSNERGQGGGGSDGRSRSWY